MYFLMVFSQVWSALAAKRPEHLAHLGEQDSVSLATGHMSEALGDVSLSNTSGTIENHRLLPVNKYMWPSRTMAGLRLGSALKSKLSKVFSSWKAAR